jgi:MFS family permease
LAYGFLLGLGVALVNSYVFERIAEVTHADSGEVASISSLLIFLSSLVGVAASLFAGTRLVQRIPRVTLARLAAVTISLGVIILLLATNIPLVALAGLLVGVGFGLTNGVELRLVHAASIGPAQRTALFGQFLAATTIPYVVASVVGLQLGVFTSGTTPVLLVALLAVSLSALMLRTREADSMPAPASG